MAKLYELADAYKRFNEIVEDALDSGEELSEDDLQMFLDTLESIDDQIEVKMENIVKFMKNIESDIEGFKREEKRLNQRRKYLENKQEGLKKYLYETLQFTGKKQVQAGSFKVKLQKSNPSVEVLNEAHVPQEYREKQPDKILKTPILKDLKDGKEIAGVVLVTDNEHLRIS